MIQITGGIYRGRPLKTPTGMKTRPTQARLRQALFNSIQTQVPDTSVLDLFAGSGALGLEALSRGAANVTFVENQSAALKILKLNIHSLDVSESSRVFSASYLVALQVLASENRSFSVILADPPYSEGYELPLLEKLSISPVMPVGGVLCLEWSPLKAKQEELPERVGSLVRVREKNYGDTLLTHFQKVGETAA